MPELKTKQLVKLGLLVVGAITAVVIFTTHPVLSVLIVVVAGAFYAIDTGKIGL